MNNLGNFIKNANGLTKNPLGIIALFISLIYGFACLVLGLSLHNITASNERLPLIWFIIIFPIIILIAFLYLVINHHEKLYGPGDFRGDSAFIETLDRKRVTEKISNEIEKLNHAEEITEIKLPIKLENNDLFKNVKLSEIIINVERFVAKDIELEYNVKVKLNQKLAASYGSEVFDIFGSNKNGYVIVEVKFWRYNKSISQLKIDIQKFINKSDIFSNIYGFQKGFKLVFAIVFDFLEFANKKELEDFVLNKEIDLRLYDYGNLKKKYQ